MSKQCPACGNVLPDDAIFCDQCGNKLPVVPENKSAAEEEPLYCRFCGT
ncbi:MAG: zinc ribbon domain-containing protein [Solobacterium sp.]|nr:zinc ribbon domain-containing protein [Solobacterium sp.]